NRFELSTPRASHWFQWLSEVDLGGFIVDSDFAGEDALTALAGAHEYRPELTTLLLVGKRGLAGHEALLAMPGVFVLPQPWTPASVDFFLQNTPTASTPASTPASTDEPAFIASLVEDLRDSLSATNGYIQLSVEADEDLLPSLLRTALDASRRMEERLNALMLSSGTQGSHPTDIDLAQLFPDCGADSAMVFADRKTLTATALVAVSWLERFGTGGSPSLSILEDGSSTSLCWHLPDNTKVPENPVQPPPFLSILLNRLAQRIPAKLNLDFAADVIPTRVTLSWVSNNDSACL
ncbi:MAG: HAMP domain-containing histidine kinase, partial [Planctomycetes bacterium]|nr:HAMP domain-containing histidine kinase [Planctomycetota bacterium]